MDNKIITYLFAYIIPCYALIIITNYIFDNNKVLYIEGTINFVIFVIIGYILYKQSGHIIPTQEYKYPFRAYYSSYGLLVSSVLILIFRSKMICNILNNKMITFISSHSLWIYLWHILFIKLCINTNINWIIKYILVLLCSITITYIQSIVVNNLEGKISKNILSIFKR